MKQPSISRHRFVRNIIANNRPPPGAGKCPHCGEFFECYGDTVIHAIEDHDDRKAAKLWERVMHGDPNSIFNNAAITFAVGRYKA